MDITELNAKLVSKLREIAKLIGITDVDKLRKQDIIKKIVASGDEQSENNDDVIKDSKETTSDTVSIMEEGSKKDARRSPVAKTDDSIDKDESRSSTEKPRKRTRLAKSPQPVADTKHTREVPSNRSNVNADLFTERPGRSEQEHTSGSAEGQRT